MVEKICNWISRIIFFILLILVLLLFVPNFIGFKTFSVISGSMEPNIPVGSLVYAKSVDFEDLEVGDVISYQLSEDTMVTHRINSINEEQKTIITKGDANDNVDSSEVQENQIIGKVTFSIPFLGYIAIYSRTPLAIIAVCIVVAILIIANMLPGILKDKEEKVL